ncbi:MAG: hypothetical protein NT136_02165 [Candidatus Moranbacteria bacterium]|nr:hypothetical protein [Candidatus Moranbacteria bacterium]
MRTKKIKAPARNVTHNKNQQKPLTEMDTDEILEAYGHSVAGGEKREIKKRKKMMVSGKSVFKIKEIIDKKSKN